MSVLDKIGKQEETYHFATGSDLGDFMSEMQRPKQNMGADPAEGLENITPNEEPIEEHTSPVGVQMQKGAAEAAGNLVFTVVDTVLPETLAFISKDKVEVYKANEGQANDLKEALTNYMRLKGGDIPPGVGVLILILMTYVAKLPMAFERRKLNEKERELEERERLLELRERESKLK